MKCGGQGRGRTVDVGEFQMGAKRINRSLRSCTVSVTVLWIPRSWLWCCRVCARSVHMNRVPKGPISGT